MKKLFIICIFLSLFLIGCTTLPFNVAICGNEICEAEEEKICLSDCTDATTESVSSTDTDTTTDSDTSGDSQTADSSTTNNTTETNTTNNTTATTDSSTTGTADSSSSSGNDDDDDDDQDDDEIIYDTQEGVACEHLWDCTNWNPCEENGMQTRICYYTGTCSVEEGQPDTRQLCTYVAPEETIIPTERTESCYDKIQNQGERDTDCGGPCPTCPTPTPVAEQPAPTWPYILLGILLLLLIVGIILAHKYKDKIKEYWNTMKMKFTKKPQKPLAPLQPPPKFPSQQQYQQYQVNQQYPRYR